MGRRIISDAIKNQVIGLYRGGKTINEIEKVIKSISKSCIARTISKYKETGTVISNNLWFKINNTHHTKL